MHVCIVGAGLMGLTSAWYLHQAGFQVTIIEREAAVALGASHGNGGQLSKGLCAPWAAPGTIGTAVKSFFRPQGPLRIRLSTSALQWRWLWLALKNSGAATFSRNRTDMEALARYSIAEWHALRQHLRLQFDQRDEGITLTLQTNDEWEKAKRLHAHLLNRGQRAELLDPAQLLQLEPGLARSSLNFTGALHLPDESSADSSRFCHELSGHLIAGGVDIRFNTVLQAIDSHGKNVRALQTSSGLIHADAYVMTTGAWSSPLLKQILKLPVYPVKGYSLTATITDSDSSVQTAILDDHDKVSVARFGNRIRVTAFAEFDGFNAKQDAKRLAQLRVMHDARFPGTADLASAETWCGFRPMTPEGSPLIGPTPLENLYINTGHGTLGWTMACGSARLLTQIMTGTPTALDAAPYSPLRYTALPS
ncbi:MAG: D-amino acid dehydrogenase [Pigmentiphaga sp.]|uniref:D-amino acid dehydrogenase n=1 Tax=Pigmentiphaga sp. TaxID=1977564 RepID=UPI0029B4A382|nr:D-amino acid dehydrogenase [Pigmentiphaga sp.]MDX3905113.1 D-amino acid dehydrogenase [Pigmentiphaga sp.]